MKSSVCEMNISRSPSTIDAGTRDPVKRKEYEQNVWSRMGLLGSLMENDSTSGEHPFVYRLCDDGVFWVYNNKEVMSSTPSIMRNERSVDNIQDNSPLLLSLSKPCCVSCHPVLRKRLLWKLLFQDPRFMPCDRLSWRLGMMMMISVCLKIIYWTFVKTSWKRILQIYQLYSHWVAWYCSGSNSVLSKRESNVIGVCRYYMAHREDFIRKELETFLKTRWIMATVTRRLMPWRRRLMF